MNKELLKQLAPNPGRYPLLPELSPEAELALLCRVLFREGYNDHIAGHITYQQADGTFLVNPWELAWDELTASDILTIDSRGKVVKGDWNVTPAINLHMDIHTVRENVGVIIHNHSHYGSIWAAAHRVPPIYDQTSAQCSSELVLHHEYEGTVNDQDKGRAAIEALGGANWALLANHGVLIVAKDIAQAYLRASTLEWRCHMAWSVEALGTEGTPLDASVAKQTGDMIEGNGFPFYWEAMARRVIRQDSSVLE